MESFSQKVKKQLAGEEVRKKCCRYMRAQMESLLPRKQTDLHEELAALYAKCRCDTCKTVFLRYLFLLYGSVTNPEKAYHLDFTFSEEVLADTVEPMLTELGFSFRRTTRHSRQNGSEKQVLYMKDSSSIEDFLVQIGASQAAFELMNSKIMRDFRNSVNRQVNCDTANIEKQLAAGKKYIEAIEGLMQSGKIESLPEDLRETARLRYENDQLSLTDLGNMLNPPVSKSGIRHRLERIMQFSRELEEKHSM